MHIISDLLISAAYVAIPAIIAFYLRRRPDVPFTGLFWLFFAFILACGIGHLIEAVIFWKPIYPVAGLVKMATAAVSIAAVVMLVRVAPAALALPRLAVVNRQLQDEVAARQATEARLRVQAELIAESSLRIAENQRRLLEAQRIGRIGDWSYDLDRDRVTWSEQLLRMFELDQAEAPPTSLAACLALLEPDSAAEAAAAVERARAGGTPIELMLAARLPSGRRAWFHSIINGERDQDGRVARLAGTCQDVTRQQSALLANDRHRRELERANQQIEQFASIAAHDLLEPLRKVRFFAGVLAAEERARLGAPAADALLRIDAASERMQRLVRDLLAFARAGRPPSALRAVQLGAAVAEALEALTPAVRESAAVISVGELPTVAGDQLLLAQVFQNLIGNAIRHRLPGQAPAITVAAAAAPPGWVEVRVEDDGPGFPADQAEQLFEPFTRMERSSGGTGLGLAICKRIVEAHGGSIAAAARADDGAAFIVRLPLRAVEEE